MQCLSLQTLSLHYHFHRLNIIYFYLNKKKWGIAYAFKSFKYFEIVFWDYTITIYEITCKVKKMWQSFTKIFLKMHDMYLIIAVQLIKLPIILLLHLMLFIKIIEIGNTICLNQLCQLSLCHIQPGDLLLFSTVEDFSSPLLSGYIRYLMIIFFFSYCEIFKMCVNSFHLHS